MRCSRWQYTTHFLFRKPGVSFSHIYRALVVLELGRLNRGACVSEELTAFRETEHGKILSSWWGRDTDYKLGIALDRVARLEDQLGEEDKEAWIDFLHNRLSLEEVCAVLNEIVQ